MYKMKRFQRDAAIKAIVKEMVNKKLEKIHQKSKYIYVYFTFQFHSLF